MASLFERIFSVVTSAIISVVVSLGLVSAPAQPQSQIAVESTPVVQEQILDNHQQEPLTSDSSSQKLATPPTPEVETKIPESKQTKVVTPGPIPISPTPTTPPPQAPAPTPTYVPIYTPAQTPPPAPTPSPQPQAESSPSPTPAPTPTSSGPIASAISLQNQVCNLSQTNLKTEYHLSDLLQNGNTDGRIVMNAYILDQNGQNYYASNPPASITITTSDHSNDKTLNGSGNTGPCGYYYPYDFYATQAGTYTITYSVPSLNLSKAITITVKLPEKPIIGSSGSVPLDSSSTQYWFQSSKPDNQYLTLSAWCSDADTPYAKVEMVSSFNSSDGLYYYRGRFSSDGQFSGSVSCKFINSANSSMTIFSESNPITFNVQ